MEEAEVEMYDNGDSSANDMGNLRNILAKHIKEPERKRLPKIEKIEC